ncbi:hypothetical protein [Actinomadura sp. 6N118]|uniref:hypothetical protein n=1 Tax=Actinomadura sp. 6N118 TaxID=3375151 RepID=UPI003793B899
MSESDDDYRLAEVRRAVDGAIDALTAYRRVLDAGRHHEPAALGKLVQAGGLLATTLVDDLTRLYASDGLDGHDLLDAAEAVVNELGTAPTGFATSIDATYHERMKRATAIMLARLWSTGRLLGPVPIEAWPSAELARLLLPAVEQHADAISVEDEIDRLLGDDDGR